MAVKSLGQSHDLLCIVQLKALWVAPGNGDGQAEKPRYDVPQGIGVINRYKAELTNQRRGSGEKPGCILPYRTVARNGGGVPLPVVCALILTIVKTVTFVIYWRKVLQ